MTLLPFARLAPAVPRPTPAVDADRLTARVVRLTLAGLVAMAVAFLLRAGVNLPVQDEWPVLMTLADHAGTWAWVAEPHSEHRFVLGRTIWRAGLLLTGYDLRAGGWIVLSGLAGAAVALVRAARRATGRSHPADVLVPALLLHAGHAFNLLMGYQIVFAAVVVCAAGVLTCAARATPGRDGRVGLVAGLWVVLTALNGGFGLGYAPAGGVWVAYLAWRAWAAGRTGRALAVFAFPVAAAGYVGWYVLTMPANPDGRPPFDLGRILATAAGYLTVGLGPWVADPYTVGLRWRVVPCALVVGVYALAGARLLSVIARDPSERARAGGLLAVWVGHLCVALGVAWARDCALAERYAAPSAVGLVVCWLTGRLYGPRWAVRPVTGLLVTVGLAVAVVAVNRPVARKAERQLTAVLRQFEADRDAGWTPTFLGGKYGASYPVLCDTGATLLIDGYRVKGIGPLRGIPPDPPMAAVPAGVAAVSFSCGAAPFLPGGPPPPAVAVPAPGRFVYGLRVAVRQPRGLGHHRLTLRWTADGADHTADVWAAPLQKETLTVTFRVYGTPTAVRLEPATPVAHVGLLGAEWLVP